MARCGVGSAGSESIIHTGGSAHQERAHAAIHPRGPGNIGKWARKAAKKAAKKNKTKSND